MDGDNDIRADRHSVVPLIVSLMDVPEDFWSEDALLRQ